MAAHEGPGFQPVDQRQPAHVLARKIIQHPPAHRIGGPLHFRLGMGRSDFGLRLLERCRQITRPAFADIVMRHRPDQRHRRGRMQRQQQLHTAPLMIGIGLPQPRHCRVGVIPLHPPGHVHLRQRHAATCRASTQPTPHRVRIAQLPSLARSFIT
jgi:hypothetical protein